MKIIDKKCRLPVMILMILILPVFAAACTGPADKVMEIKPGLDQDLTSLAPWEEVSFGSFEQDGNPGNGPEAIRWFVLDQTEEGTYLLSADCLACLPYQTPIRDITWENCTLRAWLNRDFYQTAFSDEEQQMIRTVHNRNPDNPVLHTPGGNDTKDQVFLLNESEYKAYFSSEDKIWLYARAGISPAAQETGIELTEEGFASWWLRSPGNESYSAQFIEADGNLFSGGAETDIDYSIGVRPVICVIGDVSL